MSGVTLSSKDNEYKIIHSTHVSFLSCMLYSPANTNIIANCRLIGAVQQMITIFAILLLLLLLLLIAIYDYVGTYEETIICMSGAMNNALSNWNHMNDNNTTIPWNGVCTVPILFGYDK